MPRRAPLHTTTLAQTSIIEHARYSVMGWRDGVIAEIHGTDRSCSMMDACIARRCTLSRCRRNPLESSPQEGVVLLACHINGRSRIVPGSVVLLQPVVVVYHCVAVCCYSYYIHININSIIIAMVTVYQYLV